MTASHKKPSSVKNPVYWCFVWIGFAFLVNLYIYYRTGLTDALNFFSAYLIEKSLSIDNLFVFVIIFQYFRVPKHYTHKVLFYGIAGAIMMRSLFIFLGIYLVQKFHWILYIFGIFLIYTAYRLIIHKDHEIDIGNNPVLKICKKFLPMTDSFEGARSSLQ